MRIGPGDARDLGCVGWVCAVLARKAGELKKRVMVMGLDGACGCAVPEDNFCRLGGFLAPAEVACLLAQLRGQMWELEGTSSRIAQATDPAQKQLLVQLQLFQQQQCHSIDEAIRNGTTPRHLRLVALYGSMQVASKPSKGGYAAANAAQQQLYLQVLNYVGSEKLCQEEGHVDPRSHLFALKHKCIFCPQGPVVDCRCYDASHGDRADGKWEYKCNCLGCLDAEESERLCRQAKHGHGPAGTLSLKCSCKTCRLIAYLEKAEGLPIQQIEIGLKQRRAAKVSHP